jgi:hypothetical protein
MTSGGQEGLHEASATSLVGLAFFYVDFAAKKLCC